MDKYAFEKYSVKKLAILVSNNHKDHTISYTKTKKIQLRIQTGYKIIILEPFKYDK